MRAIAAIREESEDCKTRITNREAVMRAIAEEARVLEFIRRQRERVFASGEADLRNLRAELEVRIRQSHELANRVKSATGLKFRELCIRHQLHLTMVEVRVLDGESTHRIGITSLANLETSNPRHAFHIKYLRRLRRLFVSAEGRLEKLVEKRDALADVLARSAEKSQGVLSIEEVRNRIEIFAEDLRRKEAELTDFRQRLAVDEVMRQKQVVLTARTDVRQRRVLAERLKLTNTKNRCVKIEFGLPTEDILTAGQRHGYKVKPPDLPPLRLSGMEFSAVSPARSPHSERYTRLPRIRVPGIETEQNRRDRE
jgi:hypothetical protein